MTRYEQLQSSEARLYEPCRNETLHLVNSIFLLLSHENRNSLSAKTNQLQCFEIETFFNLDIS